ncbi:hypothetical protein UFOVP582_28 [uncultured Caudovirales phage]|uniref:Uncharacterized protein n=1 Tax=uncultured Caudovirales phage TaxID=2100421 RepID=A0A6J5QWM1_9CAUD|nr:hypothetical protein UFOVP582_28 [uncultured Caudovirales phage]CAB4184004.1 hypothetical protein UFOVP1099_26 [uncultured Caudovirales phage]CAB4214355.1 hypothetical protein UFOVP1460_31 [uncultured Caudovirales phage]CAB5228872.1 hypothetical protein UFOVP1548_50 [uncultured Caudovirales phage]
MADKKITQLTAATTLADSDILVLVNDPSGTPTNKKITGANLKTAVAPDLTAYATKASPTFTGTPLSTTAAVDTNTTQVATTAYVVGQGYAKLASPTLTGTPLAPTATAGTSTTQIATTAFADPSGDQSVLAGAIFNS